MFREIFINFNLYNNKIEQYGFTSNITCKMSLKFESVTWFKNNTYLFKIYLKWNDRKSKEFLKNIGHSWLRQETAEQESAVAVANELATENYRVITHYKEVFCMFGWVGIFSQNLTKFWVLLMSSLYKL